MKAIVKTILKVALWTALADVVVSFAAAYLIFFAPGARLDSAPAIVSIGNLVFLALAVLIYKIFTKPFSNSKAVFDKPYVDSSELLHPQAPKKIFVILTIIATPIIMNLTAFLILVLIYMR